MRSSVPNELIDDGPLGSGSLFDAPPRQSAGAFNLLSAHALALSGDCLPNPLALADGQLIDAASLALSHDLDFDSVKQRIAHRPIAGSVSSPKLPSSRLPSFVSRKCT